MRFAILILACLPFFTIAQKQDSLQQVIYQGALDKMKQGNFQEASVQFSQLIATGFTNKEVYSKRGIAYFQLNEFEKAKADFDEAVKGRVNSAELFQYRGNAKYKLEDFQGSIGDLEKAVQMGVNHFETFANLGNAKFRLENYKEAITNYDKAFATGKKDPVLYNNRGKTGKVLPVTLKRLLRQGAAMSRYFKK
jgi:tetratricopeptide (TPR) repeat protein